MALPTVDEALDALNNIPARGAVNVDIQCRTAILAGAVEAHSAGTIAAASTRAGDTIAAASEALRATVAAFTEASDRGTIELATWTRSTARWTRALVFATFGLMAVAVVQVLVMLFGRR